MPRSIKLVWVVGVFLVLNSTHFIHDAQAKKSQREQDLDNLKTEKKELEKLRTQLSKDQKDLKKLKEAKENKTGSVEAQSNDCFTLCKPSSEGGNCPDELFHNAHIIVSNDVKWDAVGKKFVAGAALDQSVVRYQNAVPGSTVCEQVRNALAKPGLNPNGRLDCQTAADNCKYVRLPKEISKKEADISEDQSLISELDTHIRELKEDTSDGCADCGSAYSQREPTKAESTAMILGSIFPYFSTGLNGYLQASAQTKYYSAYSNYLTSCTTIGVPCSGPSYAGASNLSSGTSWLGASSYTSYNPYTQNSALATQSLASQQLYAAQQRYSFTQQNTGSAYGTSLYSGSYVNPYTSVYGGLYGSTSSGSSLGLFNGYLY
jgi:hypothetical protein